MDSSSRETIFDELNSFEKRKFQEVSPLLEDYLGLIARTGNTIFPWLKLKPLFRHKLDRVITEFNVTYPAKDLPKSSNIEQFDFEDMHIKLLRAVDEFSGTPFTIQRLCELIISPYKQYKRADKFMRALEKDLLVVSTIDPINQRNICDGDSNSLVNGISGSNGVLSSPHHSSSSSDDGSLNHDESSKESECSNEETTRTNVTDVFAEQMESETSCADPTSSSSPSQSSNCDQTEDEAQSCDVTDADKVSETVMAEASSSSSDLDQSLSEENSCVENESAVQEETTGECSSTDAGIEQLSDSTDCDHLEVTKVETVEHKENSEGGGEEVGEVSSETEQAEVSDVAESLLPTSTSQDETTETISSGNSLETITSDDGPSDELLSSSSEVEKMEED